MSRFKKFAPKPFKDAKDPNEAQEWLEELEGILDNLDTEEEDRMTFTEFLLQGEARTWWKMEKEKPDGGKYTWTEFQDIFLQCYFPTSVCEQKEQDFLYLRQRNLSVMEYDREFRRLAKFAKGLVVIDKDRMKRFINGLRLGL